MKQVLKNDKYRKTRGGYSRLLSISCEKCGSNICIYQKDGPGNLRRLYFNRIFFPEKLTQFEYKPLNAVPALRCPKCNEEIGTPYIYKKKNTQNAVTATCL